MTRLHALQGRANVECPKCGHPLSRHDGDRCGVCVGFVKADGYADACSAAALGADGSRMRAPYTLCATREDDDTERCPDGGHACDPGACDIGDVCPGPASLRRGGMRP